MDPYKALYIHIPFCAKRCYYCDFATSKIQRDDPAMAEYFEHLVMDIRHHSKTGDLASIETVYVGGGTPSFAGTKNLSTLFYALSLSMHLIHDVEVSMEANPESLDERLVRDVWALGVNRLSLGVQSFDDTILERLGRIHTSDGARRAIEVAQSRFENISIDLMCGLPGQSLDTFVKSIEEAIRLGVKHVSVYPLTIEEKTPFYHMMREGKIDEVDDDLEADMMLAAQELLCAAGFERYEVASYAQPGYRCRHNSAYWQGISYLGLGTSAVSMQQDENCRKRIQDGRVIDELTRPEMLAEDLMLGMRLVEGLSEEQVERRADELPGLYETLNGLCTRGLVLHQGGRWQPTEQGWLCGNELYAALMDLA